MVSSVQETPKPSPGRIKATVHARDQFRCRYCNVTTSYKAKSKPHSRTVDHLIPRSKGGRTNVINLVTACKACNDKKKSLTLREVGMVLRPAPWRPADQVKEWSRRFYPDRCIRCTKPAKRHSQPPYHGGPRKCSVGETFYMSLGHYNHLQSLEDVDSVAASV